MEITNGEKRFVRTEASHNERSHYEQVLQFVAGNGHQGESSVDAILRQMNGYSNSLLLYEIQSGIQLILANRCRQVVRWDCAWLY